MDNWRRYALPLVLWIYGMATTITLVSVWGRAIVVDAETVASAAEMAASADPVAERVETWLESELTSMPGVQPSATSQVASDLADRPSLERPLGQLVRQVVLAAARPGASSIDVAAILRPAAPDVAASLTASGVQMTDAEVASMIENLDPLTIGSVESSPVIGSDSDAARTLYLATVAGLGVMALTGWASVRLSEDPRAMRRSLLNRLAVSAGGFVVMLWLGSWIVDPGAGRAPFRSAVAELIGSKLWIPAGIALAASLGGWVWRRRRGWAASSDYRQASGHEAEQPDRDEEHAHRGQADVDDTRAELAAREAESGADQGRRR